MSPGQIRHDELPPDDASAHPHTAQPRLASLYPRVAANASLSHEVSQIFARGQISRYPDTCHTWRRFREEERDARRQIRRSMACSNFRPNPTTQEKRSTEHLFSNNSDARHKPMQSNDRKQPYHVFLIPVKQLLKRVTSYVQYLPNMGFVWALFECKVCVGRS